MNVRKNIREYILCIYTYTYKRMLEGRGERKFEGGFILYIEIKFKTGNLGNRMIHLLRDGYDPWCLTGPVSLTVT